VVLLGGILAVALAIRVSAAVWWDAREAGGFAFPDSESYWQLAEKISHGQPYQYGDAAIFRTPGYPAILAPLYWLSDHPPVHWARILGGVLGTLTVLLSYLWVKLAVNAQTGLVAAALVTLYPGAIAMSTFVLSEALFCPLMLLNLLCVQTACGAENNKKTISFAIFAGAFAAAAVLTRPSWLLFPFFALLAGMLLIRAQQRKRWLTVSVVVLLTTCVCMTPWWIRNAKLTSEFVPTTLQVGASLYDGLHAGADGSSDMQFVAKEKADLQAATAAQNLSTIQSEMALNATLRQKALTWASENPTKVVQLAGVKFLRMWNVWPNHSEFQSSTMRTIVLLGYVPLLALAVIGCWFCQENRVFLTHCLLPTVYFTLLHCVFIGSIRYRQPAVLVLIGLSAVGLVAIGNAIWKKNTVTPEQGPI
jgi:4-amino-4-deoxy-L-arabinose transferase-like glycosyltransferase